MKKTITLTILTFCLVSAGFVSNVFAKKDSVVVPKMSLHEACEFGSFTEVKEAITSANINSSVDAYGVTPIMAACRGNSSLEIFQLLIASGAKVNMADVNGKTPLMYAAEFDNYENVSKELIRAGANVNAKSGDGTTALMLACENNKNIKVIQVLIDAGANVNAVDNGGYDMADYAESNKNKDEIMALLKRAGYTHKAKKTYISDENVDEEKIEIGMNTGEENTEESGKNSMAAISESDSDLRNLGINTEA